MLKAANSPLYQKFRNQYPLFVYEDFGVKLTPEGVYFNFEFKLGEEYTFRPSAFIPANRHFKADNSANFTGLLNNIAFNIGMIELISYWKTACPPTILVKPAALAPEQIKWWKELYFNGMGEFFYVNSIEVTPDSFVEIIAGGSDHFRSLPVELSDDILVPIGGGKDSIVTLELLRRSGKSVTPLIMNPRGATVKTAETAGFAMDQVVTIQRNLDPLILKLNDAGFLNGHTPFSAMLAFYTLATALITGYRYIALSNESSANEATIPGTGINHQYSKSFEFEAAFRDYYSRYISPDFNYFSFLRPLSELQIARIFSSLNEYHAIFRSCNAGSKTDTWCGKCAKCMFAAIIISPFAGLKQTNRMIGSEMFNDPEMRGVFDELCGIAENKPFECVGTIDEVNIALQMLLRDIPENERPLLLRHFEEAKGEKSIPADLRKLNPNHFVEAPFIQLLKEALQ